MRVAIVTESFPPDVNGISHHAWQTARHLELGGHEPLVVAPSAPPVRCDGGTPDEGRRPVVHVPTLPLPGRPALRYPLPGGRLTRALAAHRPHIVHLTAPAVLGARALAAAARLGVPAVAVHLGPAPGRGTVRRGAAEAAWRRARALHHAVDRTLAPSTEAVRALADHGVPGALLWPPGVDTGRFHPGRRDLELRRALAPGGELIVGYAGRLVPAKRLDLLAPLCVLPGVRVVLAGDGPSAPALRAALPGARFLGCRRGDDLARILASLDVFVHPGRREGFCHTVQEALASGVPVVAPAAGGPLDLVGHGRTGLLVRPDDASALVEAVQTMEARRRQRVEYGLAARSSVLGRTWQVAVGELVGHYREVVGRAARVGMGWE
ncbi:glycosyltransferase [Streptomyces sp. I05A-00742]|uniref:glycosyltransferase n=1 Tax=Streptomyces sp. I05A-00742 TaxID=2732853 RepID=UPI001489CEA5|nr:glycosyltransferase [Streptomyces sp. I05A-00742]